MSDSYNQTNILVWKSNASPHSPDHGADRYCIQFLNKALNHRKSCMLGKKSDAKLLVGVDQYVFGDVIGEGASSVVRKAVDASGVTHAIKIVPKVQMASQVFAQQFQMELRIHQQLTHPGIVQVRDILKDSLFYYVVMEYCPGKSLCEYVEKCKRVPIEEGVIFMKQLIMTLHYLHSLGVCHRDIKLDNILLDEHKNCKISDFGLAVWVGPHSKCERSVGTPGYMAPEILSGKLYDPRKSDVWSLGITFYSLITGRLPWDTRNVKQMTNQIKRGRFEIPIVFGEDFARVLREMLTMDTKMRISARRLLRDPWIKGARYEFPQHSPMRIISIRKVDAIFGKNATINEFDEIMQKVEIPRSPSLDQISLEKTLQMITTKRRKHKRKKHSHRHHHRRHCKEVDTS